MKGKDNTIGTKCKVQYDAQGKDKVRKDQISCIQHALNRERYTFIYPFQRVYERV